MDTYLTSEDRKTIENFLSKTEPVVEFKEIQAIVKMLYDAHKQVRRIYYDQGNPMSSRSFL